MNKQNKQVEQAQTEKWEEEHQRVLSKAIPELLKITGKHFTLWNYSKLETIEKLSDLLSQVRQEAVEEYKKSLYSPFDGLEIRMMYRDGESVLQNRHIFSLEQIGFIKGFSEVVQLKFSYMLKDLLAKVEALSLVKNYGR